MKTILGNLSGILIAIAMVVVAWMILPRLDQYLRITALNDCGKVAKYETRPDINTLVTYPLGDMYKSCLKDKGY